MGIFGDFTVLATSITIDSRLAGWRVTATNPAVRYSFECWYREGRIYDVAFGSPAPLESSDFVCTWWKSQAHRLRHGDGSTPGYAPLV